MNKIKAFFGNKWVGFTLMSILYVLWFVVWTGNLWLLLGLVVIYDIYISQYLYRYVGRKNEEWCEKYNAIVVAAFSSKLYFVTVTSAAETFFTGCSATGMPLPLSSTVMLPSLFKVTIILVQ